MTVSHSRVGFVWLEQLWQDIKHGCRVLASSPVFTIVCVLSLAIGIGANCAIFSFADRSCCGRCRSRVRARS
jgi:hypothetical protein